IVLSPLIQDLIGYDLSFTGSSYLLLILSSAVYFYGGWPFLKGFIKEARGKKPGMMTLVAVAITVSYLYSSIVVFGLPGRFFFWELATLIVVMLLGHWVEMRSVMSASRALEELAKLLPKKAHVIRDGGVADIPVSELKKDEIVLIKPGEKVPADGELIKGETSINESMVTGESMPVSKSEGDEVIGGSVNNEGSIRVRITRTGSESYVSQVIELVKEAQKSKSRAQGLADTAAFYLTIIAISVGVITFVTWLQFNDFVFSLERGVTVIVIACPHALGLAVPLVIAVSTSISAKNGLLIRNRVAFEQARRVDVVVFDKTGTLTKGEFGVTDVVSTSRLGEDKVLSLTASLEANSNHPIAKGVVKKAENKGLRLFKVKDFKIIPGKGVKGVINNKSYKAVGNNYLKEKNIQFNKSLGRGKTITYLLREDKVVGAIALADKLRDESKEAVKVLREQGIKCVMLTGDNEEVAEWVAGELGLDEYFANVLPDEKSEIIKDLQSGGPVVAMVGDGVNDAPALTQSNIGIAIGAGTDVAVESADIVLVKNNPLDVVSVIKLSEATSSKMKQNLLWAAGYNVIALPLAAGVLYNWNVLLSPAAGAFLMSLSTVIVAINARFIKASS
ncbi:cadmium-translocating P-type ATPase, partial [archaeon]|nr:cadmium-translocating P-type ATPase [archaeon]